MSKKLMVGLSVLLSMVIVASATFAWFTSKDSRINHFETKLITDGSVSLIEIFDPPTDWKPGQEVLKNVSVVNNSETDVLVRVSFEEILKLLKNNGTMYTSPTATPTNSEWIPVHIGVGAYSTWTALTSSDTTAPIPPNLVVKKMSVTDAATGKTTSAFVAYNDLGDGTFQKVSADFTIESGKVKISNLAYFFFGGKATTYADWAGLNLVVPNGTNVVRPAAASINYTSGTGIGNTQTDALLHLKYGAVKQSMTNNNWWYNEGDGYFYYIGKLAPSAISPLLLDTVTLDSSAGNEHALMEFDLAVLMEAIQNTRAAIVATDGWNLTNTTLVDKLAEFCA